MGSLVVGLRGVMVHGTTRLYQEFSHGRSSWWHGSWYDGAVMSSLMVSPLWFIVLRGCTMRSVMVSL